MLAVERGAGSTTRERYRRDLAARPAKRASNLDPFRKAGPGAELQRPKLLALGVDDAL
jgi:hypothetical protein